MLRRGCGFRMYRASRFTFQGLELKRVLRAFRVVLGASCLSMWGLGFGTLQFSGWRARLFMILNPEPRNP